jgi:hypothetical protein
VQYETFDWRIMETDRFEIHFYPETTVDAGRRADGGALVRAAVAAFQHEFEKKPIIFYADHPDFQQTNTTFGMLTEGTGGFTEALRNRVVMPFTGSVRENDHVLGHELVHVFQYDLAQSAGGGGLQGMGRLPLWLIEGMAEYLSLGREDAHTAMWMRDAALRGELPTIRQLTRTRGSSRTATARRCGRTSRGAGATARCRRCTVMRRVKASRWRWSGCSA